MVLENRNPVPRTWMNIHQVVDNCRLLEKNVAEYTELQDNKIAYLEQKIKQQEEQFNILYASLAELKTKSDYSFAGVKKQEGDNDWKNLPIV